MKTDLGTTLIGGGAGLALLATVKWEAIPYGEAVKVVVVFGLLAVGYFMYRNGKKDGKGDGEGDTKKDV